MQFLRGRTLQMRFLLPEICPGIASPSRVPGATGTGTPNRVDPAHTKRLLQPNPVQQLADRLIEAPAASRSAIAV